jgi:simple sugar transport system ATP-binding protein
LAVEFKGISKAFGEMIACRRIDLKVKSGSIHAIVGENGAGKSTAMKILYGMLRADAGELWVNEKPVAWSASKDAIRAGVGMVHQHFMLAGPYSAFENIILGAEPRSRLGLIDFKGARKKLQSISASYGLSADWDAPIADLGVGARQRIEIIKLLYREASILILDEPTAVLTPTEVSELFTQLRKLRAEGKTILIITHKLKEVLELADAITVFRHGEVVGHRRAAETDAEDLASLMVGRRVSLRLESPRAQKVGDVVLSVQALGLSLDKKKLLSEINFEVRAGEVVGIAGVEGNGQSELLTLLACPENYRNRYEARFKRAIVEGKICILRRDTLSCSAREIRDLGVGVIPEDRHQDGLLLDRPIIESFMLGRQWGRPFSWYGLFIKNSARDRYQQAVRDYNIRPQSGDTEARRLSGGNQQKVIFAREMSPQHGKSLQLLIAAQPTRGVDVGAIEMIHGRILRAREEGVGVLLVSSELDELLALSDRILVMYNGRIVFEAMRARDQATGEISNFFDETTLGFHMGGGTQ